MELTLAICMYNAERYVRETLQSVVEQTEQDFHLLIIDDASTDASVAVVEQFLRKHTRPYELLRLQVNRGIGAARHLAERTAKTRYMMFLDSDDLLLPRAIETMLGRIEEDPTLMAVGCHLAYIDKRGDRIGGGIYMGARTKEEFAERAERGKLIFMQPTAVYDRQAALSVGGYQIDGVPSGRPRWQDCCEDLDLWTRTSDLYTEGRAIIVVPEVLCLYRKAGGLSSSSFNMLVKMRYVKSNLRRRRAGGKDMTFRDFYAALSPADLLDIQREAKAADDLRNGVFYIKRGHRLHGLTLLVKSFCRRPRYFIDKLRNNFRPRH